MEKEGLYHCDHPDKQKSLIVAIFKVMKWIANNEIVWKTITLVQTCVCFPGAVSIIPVHVHTHTHTHAHICTLLIC